jgi:hypothetical protein
MLEMVVIATRARADRAAARNPRVGIQDSASRFWYELSIRFQKRGG